jgi:hypothetical protein
VVLGPEPGFGYRPGSLVSPRGSVVGAQAKGSQYNTSNVMFRTTYLEPVRAEFFAMSMILTS